MKTFISLSHKSFFLFIISFQQKNVCTRWRMKYRAVQWCSVVDDTYHTNNACRFSYTEMKLLLLSAIGLTFVWKVTLYEYLTITFSLHNIFFFHSNKKTLFKRCIRRLVSIKWYSFIIAIPCKLFSRLYYCNASFKFRKQICFNLSLKNEVKLLIIFLCVIFSTVIVWNCTTIKMI